MGELKERFLSVYNNAVHRDGSDMLLRWLEDSDFFVAPASTKFHGCHEGGLLQHSLNVYDCLKRGLENAGLQNSYPAETVAVVSLLHGICKVNFYKKGFRNVKDEETGQWYKKEVYEIDEKFPCGEHADKSVILIQNFIGSPQHSRFGRGASCKYVGRITKMKMPERALSSKTMGSSLFKKDCCLSFC